jgi:DNA polymerase-3 subunit delta
VQVKRGLSPIYLITGDEPLQVAESTDAIRQQARAMGFEERLVFHADSSFDPSDLSAAAGAMSLFATQRLLELRLSAVPSKAIGEALVAYAEDPPPDTVLMITAPKLDGAKKKSAWYRAIDRAGAVVTVWPTEVTQLPKWVEQRMRERGLTPDSEAVAMIVQRVEGNMLAAAQEVDKLALLLGDGQVSAEGVVQAVADSARFDVFKLTESALDGDAARFARILDGLRGEGTAAAMVLWALHRDIAQLHTMRERLTEGANVDALLNEWRIWDRQKPRWRTALTRTSLASCRALLSGCAVTEEVVKGGRKGDAWQSLRALGLTLAGVALTPNPADAVN